MSKTDCFRLRVIFQGLKTVQKCKIGSDLVCFEFQIAKIAQSIGRTSYAEAKKVRNGVRKGELSFKKEGGISFTLRDSCVPSRLEAG